MIQLTEDWIKQQTSKENTFKNGKKLSQDGKFSNLKKASDETLFFGECAGSGKKPYYTSVDFIDPANPVGRCSCPSREFPCKHSIGLMFEILSREMEFEVSDIPEDIIAKREKLLKREKKEKEVETAPKVEQKTGNTVKMKKIQKQLEGLDKAELLVQELLEHGLKSLFSNKKEYEKVAKDMASYYLTGLEVAFFKLFDEVTELSGVILESDEEENYNYDTLIQALLWIHSVIQKSKVYLNEKIEKQEYDLDNSELYEALGGIWKLEELEKIGMVKENVELVQLSFDVFYDEVKQEYRDIGYWIEPQTGEVSKTIQYRPKKALKHIKAEDSCFDCLCVPKLCYYPSVATTKRVRFDNFTSKELTEEIRETMLQYMATDISEVVKNVKNEIKNTLAEKIVPVAIKYDRIAKINGQYAIVDSSGNTIVLCDDTTNDYSTMDIFERLLSKEMLAGQGIFGMIYYNSEDSSYYLQPYSVITKKQVVRLRF